jgi:hypothetical protein
MQNGRGRTAAGAGGFLLVTLLATGCGSGGSGGGVANTLPAPTGAATTRLVHAIPFPFEGQRYRLAVDGAMATGEARYGEAVMGGEFAPGASRRLTVVDLQFPDGAVGTVTRDLAPGVTTILVHKPLPGFSNAAQVSALEPNRAAANAEFAGVRVCNFHRDAPERDAGVVTVTLTGGGESRTLRGIAFARGDEVSLRPGTYEARVYRRDGGLLTAYGEFTIPEANRRYTVLLIPPSSGATPTDSDTGFRLLVDQ